MLLTRKTASVGRTSRLQTFRTLQAAVVVFMPRVSQIFQLYEPITPLRDTTVCLACRLAARQRSHVYCVHHHKNDVAEDTSCGLPHSILSSIAARYVIRRTFLGVSAKQPFWLTCCVK